MTMFKKLINLGIILSFPIVFLFTGESLDVVQTSLLFIIVFNQVLGTDIMGFSKERNEGIKRK